MKKSDLIAYRDLKPEDEPFIYATWIQGYQGGQKWFRKTPRKIFWEKYKPVIEILLKTQSTKIACLQKEPDVIIGYSVFKEDLVHWIHVKENWRKIGIAKDLLPANFSQVSHLTHVAYEILYTQRKYPHIIFNPFL